MKLRAISLFVATLFAALTETTSVTPKTGISKVWTGDSAEANDPSKWAPSIKHNSTLACTAACGSLLKEFGDGKVESPNESSYNATIDYFWSAQQREPKPHCIFLPETAREVAKMVLVSQVNECPFAVRSGGHAAFAGASSVNGGITVVLERMAAITLSEDKKIASVGAGALWGNIYTNLAEHNLTAVGGRVADIGIGGLTTGGGISFFSNIRGWACDNVASFEVVLADGRIVVAKSDSEYSDLYWALRGGGNNLGIVTRFDLETFAHGPLMYGGERIYTNESFKGAIDAFVELGKHASSDPKAQQILSLVFDASSNTKLAVSELEYADANTNAPIFQHWNNVSAISDTTGLNTLANLTLNLQQHSPKGYRQSYWTASAKLADREIVDRVVDISFEAFDKLKNVTGIIPANSLQVITVSQLELMQKNGGNALGLAASDGPILLINPNFSWNNTQDDELVLRTAEDLIAKFKQTARDMRLDIEYLYMNYASQFQDVVASYGTSADKLRRIARKYDPEGVFQRLQPGYFKLHGPPSKAPPS